MQIFTLSRTPIFGVGMANYLQNVGISNLKESFEFNSDIIGPSDH